jgi:hypothetical protein
VIASLGNDQNIMLIPSALACWKNVMTAERLISR